MKRSLEKEMMDLPDQPEELLKEDLRNLRIINRYLGGYRGVLRCIAQISREQKINGFSLLDVGTGSGDIPIRIVDWAQRRGIKAGIVALEPERVTARIAARLIQQANPPFMLLSQRLPSNVIPAQAGIQGREGDFQRCGISVVRGDAMSPPFPSSSFDFVLASQLLHHFSEEQIIAVLQGWTAIARKAIIVSDLIRHPVAYCGIRLITRLFTQNIMTITDAPLSVKRAFTRAEWRDLFRRASIGPFRISSVFPYRMVTTFFLADSR
jgi:SAM-dependent methyltransferase